MCTSLREFVHAPRSSFLTLVMSKIGTKYMYLITIRSQVNNRNLLKSVLKA